MRSFFDILLAKFSLLYYNSIKKQYKKLLINAFKPNNNSNFGFSWSTLTQWLEKSPENLDLMMMIGPRWNCHAVIGLSDVFQVSNSISFYVQDIINSATFWTIVIYSQDFKTVKHIGSKDNLNQLEWKKVNLNPGNYFLGLRYYETDLNITFPAIKVDGKLLFTSYDASSEKKRYENYLNSLKKISKIKFLLMHLHAYIYIKHRNKFRDDWIRKHYLPVGNPETHFSYGLVKKGDMLNVEPMEQNRGITFISIYNRSSIPVFWAKIENTKSIRATCSGTYLIRHISTS